MFPAKFTVTGRTDSHKIAYGMIVLVEISMMNLVSFSTTLFASAIYLYQFLNSYFLQKVMVFVVCCHASQFILSANPLSRSILRKCAWMKISLYKQLLLLYCGAKRKEQGDGKSNSA